jgi:DNA relaxase NicK
MVGINTQLQVGIDWLQFTCKPVDDVHVEEVVKAVCMVLEDRPVFFRDKSTFMGKQWQHRGHSIKGMKFWYDSPSENSPHAHLLISLTGEVLGGLSVAKTWELCRFLIEVHQVKFTRVDIALDDYAKSVKYADVADAAMAGNYAYVKQISPYITHERDATLDKAFTVYIGSTQSDKFVRFYNKDRESNGEINSYRWEMETKDESAHKLITDWLEIPDDGFEELSPCFLAGKILGIVSFVYRKKIGFAKQKNITRLERYEWWKSFVNSVGGALRHSVPRPDTSFEKKKKWLERAVFGSVAVIRKVMGIFEFNKWSQEELAKAEEKFTDEQCQQISLWSQQKSNILQQSDGVAEIVDEEGQKWAWVWHKNGLDSCWMIARYFGCNDDGEARVRFSGESARTVLQRLVHLGKDKPSWFPTFGARLKPAVS